MLFFICGILATVLFAPNVYGSPTGFSLSDDVLMTFGETYTNPQGWARVVGATDVDPTDPVSGVEYDIQLLGLMGIEIGIGAASPQADLSAYTDYFLKFANTSDVDAYGVNLYVKTGPDEAYYGTGWTMLFPQPFSQPVEVEMDLSSVLNLDDVREIGFGVKAWVGTDFGYAFDHFQVVAADPPGGQTLDLRDGAVPEASTLVLFGSGLVGLLAFARRKLPFLTK